MPKIIDSEPSKNGRPAQNGRLSAIPTEGKIACELPEWARDPNLIEKIEADIAALGVVGEAEAGLLVYLAGTSRILTHPIRLIFRGPSSAGKSHVQGTVSLMFPPEDVIEATSLTPQALYYLPQGSLEHKFVVKGERSFRSDDEGQDATAALRQMISENRIVKVVTGKNLETRRIEQKGPISFCESTTAKSIFVEDLNRCIQVHADDSSRQTRRVVRAVAEEYLETAASSDPERIIDRHRKFQLALRYVDVRIPFARALAEWLPTDKLEARRVIKQLLATVEVIALLYQHQRTRNEQGHLLATIDDYAIARRLLIGPLSESLGCGDRIWHAYQALRRQFPNGFDSTQVLKAGTFTNKMTRDRRLKELTELGVLQRLSEGKGKTAARWGWTENALKPVLPAVEDLRNS
jgi:hypothetical protein